MVPGHVTVTPDPLGGAFNVMRFAVADSDRPYSGASNPRADFETPGLFGNGADLYSSIKFLIPAGFPQLSQSFFQIAEIYGPPHGGSPPIGIDLVAGTGGRPRVVLERDANFGYDQPWAGPTLDTGWHTIYLHTKMAPDATGSVQLWFDGQPQTFTNGSQTINYPTLASGINWDGHTPDVPQRQSVPPGRCLSRNGRHLSGRGEGGYDACLGGGRTAPPRLPPRRSRRRPRPRLLLPPSGRASPSLRELP